MAEITQTISDVGQVTEPPNPNVPATYDTLAYPFSTSLKVFGDNVSTTLVGQLNTFGSQANSLRLEVNGWANIASEKADIATTQAGLADTARIAAQNAQAAVETVFDNFDDRYLGAKATPPTVDNDGNPLQDGALFYRNTAPKGVHVYDLELASWINTGYTPTSHSGLSGLANDDHPQYHNDARGDARYYTKTEGIAVITSPTITAPANGAVDFNGAITTSAYATSVNYQGSHDFTHWQLSYTADFATIELDITSGNLTSWTPAVGVVLQQCYVRVRHGSDNHLSGWSPIISFTTPNIYVQTPTVSVTGTPSDVPETPTISTSAFSVYNGTDTHASTDWIVKQGGTTVWSSIGDATNKTSITIPSGVLLVSTAYTFEARHNGATYGVSGYGSASGTTKSAFTIPIGVAGAMDFGVAPSSEAWAVMGLAEMTGTNTAGHDNWGNYQHTNGSIVCHVPKFYYRIGNALAPQYATYGANSIEIVGTESFTTEAAANAAGWTLHRAFLDGGAEKGGFFIDKYMNSKKVGDTNVAVSVKNGNPIGLTTNTTYTPSSTMAGCTGILADAITLSRARGSYWNTASAFMYGAIALLSIAHGQRATSSAACGWYDASLTMNFPKGCNNGSLADVNDTSVTWSASPDTAVKGLTGSASTFNKSTHNGQNNGIADVNGLMYEVGIGVTNYGTSATTTTTITTNTIYTLKSSVALKNLTAGWDGATDAWGNTTNLSTRFDAVTCPTSINATTTVCWGNGTNAVFDGAVSGVGRDLCGILPKNDTSSSATGTNMCGNDYLYRINKENWQPLFCGYLGHAANAGVLYRNLNNYRSYAYDFAGFRAAAYV